MGVQQFMKRPVIIEAMQWTGNNEAEIQEWTGEDVFYPLHPEDAEGCGYPEATAELRVAANGGTWLPMITGEWVLHDSAGFYPCKAAILVETYEEVL
jgi:hypothetical protein